MRLTESRLRQIIKEELSRVMSENIDLTKHRTWPMTDAGEPDWDAIAAAHPHDRFALSTARAHWADPYKDLDPEVARRLRRSSGSSGVASTGRSSAGAYASQNWDPYGTGNT